ncbi:MAG TPA: PAS domain-containing protein, partial [Flavisolibacter sp.]|nr:PAS domain-containing protein [Flavisolibacter sp.]
MKKLNQLLIIEADDDAPPLLPQFPFLPSFSERAPVVLSLKQVSDATVALSFHFIMLHSRLTTMHHFRQFVELYTSFPYSSIVIVSPQQDEELGLLALEAGAEDCIKSGQLTPAFMSKAVITSLRRNRAEYEVSQYRTQLLACLQNTPNVAVQWYNSKSEVLFWNKASEAIFGWTAEEAMGKRLQELINAPASEALWLYKMQH